jgi:hypothetical protein
MPRAKVIKNPSQAVLEAFLDLPVKEQQSLAPLLVSVAARGVVPQAGKSSVRPPVAKMGITVVPPVAPVLGGLAGVPSLPAVPVPPRRPRKSRARNVPPVATPMPVPPVPQDITQPGDPGLPPSEIE